MSEATVDPRASRAPPRKRGESRRGETGGDRGPARLLPRSAEGGRARSLGLLRRPVFPVRAFTTCWGSDLLHSGVEVAFGRDRDLKSLLGLLLALGRMLGIGEGWPSCPGEAA